MKIVKTGVSSRPFKVVELTLCEDCRDKKKTFKKLGKVKFNLSQYAHESAHEGGKKFFLNEMLVNKKEKTGIKVSNNVKKVAPRQQSLLDTAHPCNRK